jgi:glutamyl-tRNA synthetase
MLVYTAMDWPLPVYAHIPLIHGEDGKKLSKRHGALGVEDWRAMGYPAAAMRNYLARLGWSHGDDEFFTDAQALDWFDLDGIGRAPARLDVKKLDNLSGRHIAAMPDADLVAGLLDFCAATQREIPDATRRSALLAAMPALKDRAKTYIELLEKAHFCLTNRPIDPDSAAAAALDAPARAMLADLTPHLRNASWNRETLEAALGAFAEARDTKFGKLAGPLRAALAGRGVSPSVYDMMLVLGRDETLARLADAAARQD